MEAGNACLGGKLRHLEACTFINRDFTGSPGASLVAQLVKNVPAMQEAWVQSLGCQAAMTSKAQVQDLSSMSPSPGKTREDTGPGQGAAWGDAGGTHPSSSQMP